MAFRMMMLAVATGTALGGGTAYTVLTTRSTAPIINAAYTETVDVKPQRLVIGLDLSKSNPLVDDTAFAAKVAQRIAERVQKLGFASEVHIRTFGNYDATSNTFYYDTQISTRARPDQVAAEVRKLIAGTPMLVSRGKWKSQNNTNILAFLDNVQHSLGCAKYPTTIILASDGIEDSEYVKLGRKDAKLPTPEGAPFKGCAGLEILGLGQGTKSPTETVRLRRQWSGWAKAAGFAHFTGLNDW
ncbi:MAG TPA: hypothetical protein VFI93_03660 [Rhizomicrobium sp.]|nr:hypothetical protein [Rhizomicrobium sp.]